MTSDSPSPENTSESIASEVSIDLNQSAKTDAPFPVVGIAASAGGLEAFTELIGHLPTDTGMAFVLIQHLSPDHKSLLSEILGRATAMPVRQVEDRMMVEPNEVYIIPPNTQMTLVDGMLHLAPRQKSYGKYMPGDTFFESLAADRGNKAIAVVLSGADGDGSLGLKAIKVAGGVTFAQCESTAKFNSMPNTAVATGNVDFVLPPKAIAEELTKLSRSPFLVASQPLQVVKELPDQGDAMTTIFALLRTSTGVDFSDYKPTTLNRRLQRRMLLYKLESLEDYAEYLQQNPAEVQALYEEILIHVTSFFRDHEAFEQLKKLVFPTISQNKSSHNPIRIWVAGCSTGEEVYSIAICLLEFLSERATVLPIQIFATDISEAAISRARSGFYLETQMEAVSPERRNRFFVPLANGDYQISSAVRELCVFARHNLGGDPPFSNLDLISCRNVLIYLSDSLQEQIMPLFHYSLNLTGFLMLGTSESVKTFSDLFSSVHEASKIYARRLTLTRPLFSFSTNAYTAVSVNSQQRVTENIAKNFDLARSVDQVISNRYVPVSVVINEQMHILQLRGETDPYLKLSPGTTDLNLLLMAREGLAIVLRSAIYQAQTQKTPVRVEQIDMESGERSIFVNLEVIPFQPTVLKDFYFLVIFEAVSPPIIPLGLATGESPKPADLERETVQLRQALAAATQRELSAQAHLQAVIQEQNYLNQSLRVANEEILSSNEELQSTNEELETAKEEIQATNEELSTTNDELRNRNLQQNRDNSDLNNLIASISIPIVMLTNDLRIRRFTPTAQRLFNFIPGDVGRPFNDLRANFDVPNLEPMISEVLETLNTKEQEIQTQAGYWYSLRIRPYRTTENQIDGVTMVFFDIDALKRNAATLDLARDYAETIVETVQFPLVVLDADLRVNTANRSFYEMFQFSALEAAQFSLFGTGNGQWNIPQVQSVLEDILIDNIQIQNFEVNRYFEQIGQKTMLLNACKLQRQDEAAMILLSIEDITERKQFETERSQLLMQEQLARQQAEIANRAKDDFLSNLSHELRNPLNIMLGWSQLLRTRTLNEAAVDRALEVIERSVKAQSQLIEDLLDVSRIMSGKLLLNIRPIDLRLIVQAALDILQLAMEAKNIQIVSSLSSITVLGDIDRLQQVLWNLLSNAIKFTPAGGRVEVTLLSVGNRAQIQISDTGQGIGADLLPQIFDRFRQGDSSTTKRVAGLGLGLSIVRHLVDLHGGEVQAQSAGEGQGATLTVWLPLQSPTQKSTPPSVLKPFLNAEPDRVPSLAGLKILAVDDDIDSLELLKFVLENYGAQVLTAICVKDAIAALSETSNRYDVLISDIAMPESDGYSLIRQVRSLGAEASGQIPAIALTAYASEREQQRAIAAGFQMHVAKPVEPVQLAWVIANLVQGV
ncbi:CheR family methyltransferase [Argonema antarcticum]|uniref:CheR family methyltransferase n=1 Tax=Argonema antarcticum TaxID=2942763 RepID=UPI002013827F|nr:chemotaxis protein CheB [Argonema antarcticum]MCL1474060.1 PAS domain-containing protein [Argonema antarcticum A004/B2]